VKFYLAQSCLEPLNVIILLKQGHLSLSLHKAGDTLNCDRAKGNFRALGFYKPGGK